MATTLLEAEVLLSKELGDYWASTTTSNGDSTGTTLVDTALKAKHDDWITDGAYDMLTSGTYDEEERKILKLDNDAGTLTMLAHGGQIVSSVTYRIHRLFTASEKRLALIDAAKRTYPHIFTEVRDESMVSGNWLKDGSFEIWTASDDLTYWTASSVTLTQTTDSPYYKHGKTSCKLSGTAGYVYQSISEWDDLKRLAGKTVTFTVQGYSTAASSLRLSIYDGTTTTNSDYHDGDSAWTEDTAPLTVTAVIQDNPTAIQFRINYASGTAYVDDARVFGIDGARIYIGDLGLVNNEPHQVLRERDYYSNAEPWALIHGITYDRTNGYMYLPNYISSDYRLRILGVKYLDFADSGGTTGTDWDDDSVTINEPQTQIVVAQAAMYLCSQMVMPNWETGETNMWSVAYRHWERELAKRKAKFGMETPGATKDWGA